MAGLASALRGRRPARLALLIGLALAGCGDDGGATPSPGNVPTGPRGPAPPAGPKTLLAVKPHVEDRVACAIPDQPSDPKGGKCDLKAPSCGEHLYCLPLAQGGYCEPCPERDGIRHTFRDRDFDPEHNRDPFQSFRVQVVGGSPGPDPSTKCPREDQLVASSYSYADLKLVGIVAQGTQRKALMTMGKEGYIVKRGDCIGKEKAIVKDIGLGYVTFRGEADDISVQLNPKQLLINEPLMPAPARRTTIGPLVTPPATLPPAALPPAAPPPAAQAPAVPPPRAPPAGSNAAPAAPGGPPAAAAPPGSAPGKP